MKGQSFEIWRNESSQTWKVFRNMTEEIRQTLHDTGWSEVVQYPEDGMAESVEYPEELLRQVCQAIPGKVIPKKQTNPGKNKKNK